MPTSITSALKAYSGKILSSTDRPVSKILPLIFQLQGKPYSLDWSHFMFEPMFRLKNCPRQMVWKTGRQVSKTCYISSRQQVLLHNGRRIPGEKLEVGDTVLGLDNRFRVTAGRVLHKYPSNPKPGFRIETRCGYTVEAASTHPFRTLNGFVPLSELKVGSRIAAVTRGGEFTGTADIPVDLVRVIAYLIGDGHMGVDVGFTKHTEALEDFKGCLDRLKVGYSLLVQAGCTRVALSGKKDTSSVVHQTLADCGLRGTYSEGRFIPAWVFDLSREHTSAFVEALWATDGCIVVGTSGFPTITYCSVSHRLAWELHSLLLKFGIFSTVTRRKTTYTHKEQKLAGQDAYIVRVEQREGYETFFRSFKVPGKPPVPIPDVASNNNRDTTPVEVSALIRSLARKLHINKRLHTVGLRATLKYPIGPPKLKQYVEHFTAHLPSSGDLQRLIDIANADVAWDEIESITPIDPGETWDIEVEDTHTYLLDGLVSHNSTSIAGMQILRAAAQANYNILTVMPLYEQTRKFSVNYVRPFLVTSPARGLLVGENSVDSVLQRGIGSIAHNSSLFYSYSHGDPSRIRGIQASECNFDETQDLQLDDLPVIEACMSASRYKLTRYTGTPKTFDNTLHKLWEDSSQACWHIPCQETGCKHENRCDVKGDLLKMLGETTLSCAKCGKPVNSRLGYWVHDVPALRMIFPGYHVSQPILPMHYLLPKDWFILKQAQKDKPPYLFYNEYLGESFDSGTKMLTKDELVAAATAECYEPDETYPSGQYVVNMLGVDWGGRGKEKTTDTDDFVSNTALALAGLRPDGVIEINWLHKVAYAMTHDIESEIVANVAARTNSAMVAMDYGGQGNVQEQLLMAKGWPREKVIPFTYNVMQARRPIVFYQPPRHFGVRNSYTLDKPRSLILLVQLIKAGKILLPKGDRYINDHLKDFLNIFEETMDNPRGAPRRLVRRLSRRTDDIVHAINFAVMGIYHLTSAWPQLARAFMDASADSGLEEPTHPGV